MKVAQVVVGVLIGVVLFIFFLVNGGGSGGRTGPESAIVAPTVGPPPSTKRSAQERVATLTMEPKPPMLVAGDGERKKLDAADAKGADNGITTPNTITGSFPPLQRFADREYGSKYIEPLNCSVEKSVTVEGGGDRSWCRLERFGSLARRKLSFLAGRRVFEERSQQQASPSLASCGREGEGFEPIRQGNFAKIEAQEIYGSSWPHRSETVVVAGAIDKGRGGRLEKKQEELDQYFAKVPSAVDPLCHICKGRLEHPALYSQRRWWRIRYFSMKEESHNGKRGGEGEGEVKEEVKSSSSSSLRFLPTIIGLNRNSIDFYKFDMSWNDPVNEDLASLKNPLTVRLPPITSSSGSPSTSNKGKLDATNEDQDRSTAALFLVKIIFDTDDDGRTPSSYLNLTDSQVQDLGSSSGSSEKKGTGRPAMELHAKKRGGGGGQSSIITIRIEFALPVEGQLSLWNACQLYRPDLIQQLHERSDHGNIGFFSRKGRKHGSELQLMKSTTSFPYLPCYVFRLTEKMRECERLGNYDNLKNYWPSKCEARRQVLAPVSPGALDWDKEGGKDEQQQVKVAVAFSGFLRSFAQTKGQIFENLVKPHSADVYGATWNIVGRTAKMKPIGARETISCQQMFQMLSGLLGLEEGSHLNPCNNPEVNDGQEGVGARGRKKLVKRVDVMDYHKHRDFHSKVLEQNGFPHAGLYFTLCRSLALIRDSSLGPYDIVIRTRFDIFPLVPFVFHKKETQKQDEGDEADGRGTEFHLDLHSSCQMQGGWFPQHAVVRDGLILKHYADTRFKLFTYQVCDWIEVGTYASMMKLVGLYDWIIQNSVFSGAQFVEHAYHIDQELPYQPLNLFLKILRAPKKPLFG